MDSVTFTHAFVASATRWVFIFLCGWSLPAIAQQRPLMKDFIGVNTRVTDKIKYINKFNAVREYHQWSSDTGYDGDGVANCPTNYLRFNPSFHGSAIVNFDNFYQQLSGRISPSMDGLAPEMRGLMGYDGLIQEQKQICLNGLPGAGLPPGTGFTKEAAGALFQLGQLTRETGKENLLQPQAFPKNYINYNSGDSYNLTVNATFTSTPGCWGPGIKIWIDANGDGVFNNNLVANGGECWTSQSYTPNIGNVNLMLPFSGINPNNRFFKIRIAAVSNGFPAGPNDGGQNAFTYDIGCVNQSATNFKSLNYNTPLVKSNFNQGYINEVKIEKNGTQIYGKKLKSNPTNNYFNDGLLVRLFKGIGYQFDLSNPTLKATVDLDMNMNGSYAGVETINFPTNSLFNIPTTNVLGITTMRITHLQASNNNILGAWEYPVFISDGSSAIANFSSILGNTNYTQAIVSNAADGVHQLKLPINQNNPVTYLDYAKWTSILTARYGNNPVCANGSPACQILNGVIDGDVLGMGTSGLGFLKYIEMGNEPDKYWHDGEFRNTPNAVWQMLPDQYAALLSATYDGNGKSPEFGLPPDNTGYLGVKNIDPSIKVAMAGISEFRGKFFLDMMQTAYNLRVNNPNATKKLPFDILNIHHYTGNDPHIGASFINNSELWDNWDYDGLKNGGPGFSPEKCQLKLRFNQFFKKLLDESNASYKPELLTKEVWFSEFGYDSNNKSPIRAQLESGTQSFFTTQAQWIVRSFLELSAVESQGMIIHKAMMYEMRDGSNVASATPFACNYTFKMTGAWNGGKVNIIQGGIVVTTLSGPANGTSQDKIISLCGNPEFQVVLSVCSNSANGIKLEILNPSMTSLVNYTQPNTCAAGEVIYNCNGCHSGGTNFSDGFLFNHSGLLTNQFKPKRAWYYVQTLKNVLGDTRFTKDLNADHAFHFDNGGDDPMIYYYKGQSQQILAIWSPTAIAANNKNLTLKIDEIVAKTGKPFATNTYSIVQIKDFSEVGFKKGFDLTPMPDQKMLFNSSTVQISETPIFVLLGEKKDDPIVNCPMNGSPTITPFCNSARIKWEMQNLLNPIGHWQIYYAKKSELDLSLHLTNQNCGNYANVDLMSNTIIHTYTDQLEADRKRILLDNLQPSTEYVVFMLFVNSDGIAAQTPCVICFSTNNNAPCVINPCLKLESNKPCEVSSYYADNFRFLVIPNKGIAENPICAKWAQAYTSGNPIAVIGCDNNSSWMPPAADPSLELWSYCNDVVVTITFQNFVKLDALRFFYHSGRDLMDIYYAECDCPDERKFLTTFDPAGYAQGWISISENLPLKAVKKLYFVKRLGGKGRTIDLKVGGLHFCGEEVTDCTLFASNNSDVKHGKFSDIWLEDTPQKSALLHWKPVAEFSQKPVAGNYQKYEVFIKKQRNNTPTVFSSADKKMTYFYNGLPDVSIPFVRLDSGETYDVLLRVPPQLPTCINIAGLDVFYQSNQHGLMDTPVADTLISFSTIGVNARTKILPPTPQPERVDFNAYPNPTSGNLTIEWQKTGFSELLVFNTNGVLMQQFKIAATQTNMDCNIETLPPGAYLFQLRGDGLRPRQKLIILSKL